MKNKEDLLFLKWKSQVRRSNLSYQKYLSNKTYLAANRIYNANQKLYSDTVSLVESDFEMFGELIELLWHLDDWILHFEYYQKKDEPLLGDLFAFVSIEGSIKYPTELLQKYLE